MEKENGCGVYRHEHRYDIDGIRYHECVCGFRNPSIGLYLDLEDKFSKGVLPFEGAYMDQPAKVIEIINRITNLKIERQQRLLKEQEREYKKGK